MQQRKSERERERERETEKKYTHCYLSIQKIDKKKANKNSSNKKGKKDKNKKIGATHANFIGCQKAHTVHTCTRTHIHTHMYTRGYCTY